MSALGVDVLSTLWADNASSMRRSAPLYFLEPVGIKNSSIPQEGITFFEIRAVKTVVLVAARLSECCSVFLQPLILFSQKPVPIMLLSKNQCYFSFKFSQNIMIKTQ